MLSQESTPRPNVASGGVVGLATSLIVLLIQVQQGEPVALETWVATLVPLRRRRCSAPPQRTTFPPTRRVTRRLRHRHRGWLLRKHMNQDVFAWTLNVPGWLSWH